MTGSKHAFAVMQLEERSGLCPDAHVFAQSDFCQSDPNVVASIMTQLSLKVGLKDWGEKARLAKLRLCNAFKPKH
jgi:hypothetical protein